MTLQTLVTPGEEVKVFLSLPIRWSLDTLFLFIFPSLANLLKFEAEERSFFPASALVLPGGFP